MQPPRDLGAIQRSAFLAGSSHRRPSRRLHVVLVTAASLTVHVHMQTAGRRRGPASGEKDAAWAAKVASRLRILIICALPPHLAPHFV